ncbi:MAG: hypothetical protein JNG84_11925 [Archangium sp.]|nr:hypothetical protein [Archangium sp.]
MAAVAERRLCIFFEAAGTRYALEASGVHEVAQPDESDDRRRGHHVLRDLSELMGGPPAPRPGTALVLETSPTLAIRVGHVAGVHDAGGMPSFTLPRRLNTLLSPAIRGAVVMNERLHFELETDAVAEGISAPPPVERAGLDGAGPWLRFDSGAERFAVPLASVRHVAGLTDAFNPLPRPNALVGVMLHERTLFPVFSITSTTPEPFVVLLDLGDGGVGLCARRADGVSASIGDAKALDVVKMFS